MACAGDERVCSWDATFLTRVTGLTLVSFPQTHLRFFLPHVPSDATYSLVYPVAQPHLVTTAGGPAGSRCQGE